MRRQLRERLRARIVRDLAPRAQATEDLKASLAELNRQGSQCEEALARAEGLTAKLTRELAAATAPFTPDMTVHAAWARHPGVEAIFASHNLPACPDCAVGADETLAEAAFGYALSLNDLLDQLNTLLRPDAHRGDA